MKRDTNINPTPETQQHERQLPERLFDPLPVRIPEEGGELPGPIPVLPAVVPWELLAALVTAPPGVVEYIDRIATAHLEELLRRDPSFAEMLDDLLLQTWSVVLPPPVLPRPPQESDTTPTQNNPPTPDKS